MDTDYQTIAKQKSTELNTTIYVVEKDGSYIYLRFEDDFSYDDVVYVAKTL
jgi:hypothetical protein